MVGFEVAQGSHTAYYTTFPRNPTTATKPLGCDFLPMEIHSETNHLSLKKIAPRDDSIFYQKITARFEFVLNADLLSPITLLPQYAAPARSPMRRPRRRLAGHRHCRGGCSAPKRRDHPMRATPSLPPTAFAVTTPQNASTLSHHNFRLATTTTAKTLPYRVMFRHAQ